MEEQIEIVLELKPKTYDAIESQAKATSKSVDELIIETLKESFPKFLH